MLDGTVAIHRSICRVEETQTQGGALPRPELLCPAQCVASWELVLAGAGVNPEGTFIQTFSFSF